MTHSILEVKNLNVAYNKVVKVLRGINLHTEQGKVNALLGANGAGKSTTLKAISGLLSSENGKITDGQVVFQGENITNTTPERIVQMGLIQVLEGRRIIQDMTVEENLKLGAFTRKDRKYIRKDIDIVYEFFPRLKERHGQAGYLSGGEQQMLAIGRALMARPKLILMDEPSMGLSPLLVKEVFRIIKKLNSELQLSIFLIEQNANMALRASSHAFMMEHGEIVLDGDASELMQRQEVKEIYLGGSDKNASTRFSELKRVKRAEKSSPA